MTNTTRPAEETSSLRAALTPDDAAQILLAIIEDIQTMADRLERVATAMGDLPPGKRISLGTSAPPLFRALLDVENYHANRQGVV